MLSKHDIQKEMLNGGIAVVPFNIKNLKENSLNLCTSDFAYTMSDYTGEYYGSKITIKKGESAVVDIKGKKVIILPPQTAVLINTKEVIFVTNNIGGAYHSKVGITAKGISHIGTMLGPNFKGHSLICLTNNTNKITSLDVGESFISITFNYLKTPLNEENPTSNAHEDKYPALGIHEERMDILNEDWKSKSEAIIRKFKKEADYEELKSEYHKELNDRLRDFFTLKKIIGSTVVVAILVIIIIVGVKLQLTPQQIYTILGSGILCVIFTTVYSIFKKD